MYSIPLDLTSKADKTYWQSKGLNETLGKKYPVQLYVCIDLHKVICRIILTRFALY